MKYIRNKDQWEQTPGVSYAVGEKIEFEERIGLQTLCKHVNA